MYTYTNMLKYPRIWVQHIIYYEPFRTSFAAADRQIGGAHAMCESFFTFKCHPCLRVRDVIDSEARTRAVVHTETNATNITVHAQIMSWCLCVWQRPASSTQLKLKNIIVPRDHPRLKSSLLFASCQHMCWLVLLVVLLLGDSDVGRKI